MYIIQVHESLKIVYELMETNKFVKKHIWTRAHRTSYLIKKKTLKMIYN